MLATIAALAATGVAIAAIELWVRSTWDHTRGTPGIFLSDAWRGQRLAPGYEGWFAGVPVRINRLGFRDTREYTLDKSANTFRILVIGDSVTFGHGAVFESTYPFLLEQRLRKWRPDLNWEVWNLGVPGYNTRQELTYLKEVGLRFQPDLVIVGFYPNDFTGNEVMESEPGWVKVAAAPVIRTLQRHLYSFEFYKRVYLTARWRLSSDNALRQQLEHLQTEADLLDRGRPALEAHEQALTAFDSFDDQDVDAFRCPGMPHHYAGEPGDLAKHIESQSPSVQPWLNAVREFQHLAREGVYRIVFFINMAPEICKDRDRFYAGYSLADDKVLLKVLGEGTPTVSSTRAFLHHRPSQMPLAGGHSLGNSNVVKANVLFEFLVKHLETWAPRPEA